VILPRYFDPNAVMHEPLSTVLALAVAGFFTASILAVHWFIGAFSGRDKSSKQDHPISKGASR
jgi:hypothetical protein